MQSNLKNQKGFTLIELVVVMVILALLAAVAVPKFLDLQKQAEAASVKKVLGNMRSALSIRVASALLNGENLSTLVTTLNPFELLSNVPANNAGSITNLNQIERGEWGEASTGSHDVYYHLKNVDIVSNPDSTEYLRYEIEVLQDTVNGVTTDVGLTFEKYENTAPDIVDVGTTDDADYDWNY